MKTRDLFTPENADSLDDWCNQAPNGSYRAVHVSSVHIPAHHNEPEYTKVEIDLHEYPNEYTSDEQQPRAGHGWGKDFEEAIVIAMRRFLGNIGRPESF